MDLVFPLLVKIHSFFYFDGFTIIYISTNGFIFSFIEFSLLFKGIVRELAMATFFLIFFGIRICDMCFQVFLNQIFIMITFVVTMYFYIQ